MAEQRNNGEFHRADPAWRRRMLIVLVLIVLLGVGGLVALNMWLTSMGARISNGDLFGYERSLHQVLGTLCLVLGVAAATFATWLFKIAGATHAERRWPPSHMRTSADVRIRYLTSADSLVTQMRAGAFGLVFVAVGLLVWGAWLLKST